MTEHPPQRRRHDVLLGGVQKLGVLPQLPMQVAVDTQRERVAVRRCGWCWNQWHVTTTLRCSYWVAASCLRDMCLSWGVLVYGPRQERPTRGACTPVAR